MSFPSYPIRDLLKKPETQLGKLFAHAKTIDDLNLILMQVLDPDLASHCRVGSYHQGVLLLLCSSSAFATTLRYQVPGIISKLRSYSQWAGLSSIQVKVQTLTLEIPPDKIKHRPEDEHSLVISEVNKSQLQALIDDLKTQPGMDALIKSLEKLTR